MRQLKDIGWGGSSAGRALRSQCRGREFDPPPLHQFTDILKSHGNMAFCVSIALQKFKPWLRSAESCVIADLKSPSLA